MNDWRKKAFMERYQYLDMWKRITILVVVLGWKVKRHLINALTFPAKLIDDWLTKTHRF